jgi:mono/diheme cytochrome c family protein
MKIALKLLPRSLPFRYWKLGLLIPAMLALTGCFGVGMYQQARYNPLAPSDFFSDGRSARPIPAGAIPQGTVAVGNPVLSGKGADGNPVQEIPVPVTMELLQQGQDRFTIYCTPCHGTTGDGKGVIVQHGMPQPPSFHTEAMYQAPAGHYFDVITNGFGKMLPYGYRVKPDERWAIVAYIRALQLSQNANQQNLPPEDRQKLESLP